MQCATVILPINSPSLYFFLRVDVRGRLECGTKRISGGFVRVSANELMSVVCLCGREESLEFPENPDSTHLIATHAIVTAVVIVVHTLPFYTSLSSTLASCSMVFFCCFFNC